MRAGLGPPAAPAPPSVITRLASQVATTRSVFQQGRYTEVAHALPGLLRSAIATADHTPGGRTATHLAELYTLSTELMIKLGQDHVAWTTAERALQAAYASDDVLVLAAARRAWGMALRRAGRAETANRLVLDTATTLQPELRRGAEHMSMYGSLLATASYTAASGGDRDTAHTLITEAGQIADRVGDSATASPHRLRSAPPASTSTASASPAPSATLEQPSTSLAVSNRPRFPPLNVSASTGPTSPVPSTNEASPSSVTGPCWLPSRRLRTRCATAAPSNTSPAVSCATPPPRTCPGYGNSPGESASRRKRTIRILEIWTSKRPTRAGEQPGSEP